MNVANRRSRGERAERRSERVLFGRQLAMLARLFRRLDNPFSAIPRRLDPMAQTGAVANVTFLIAVVTGILLLLWYVPSVHRAYDSVSDMMGAPWTAGLVRSLHRYSSDACVFFVLVHWARMVAEKRFGGARWVAWVTGVIATAMLWLVGWTGYWLVWDQAGQEVAVATAKMLDVVPVFVDPLSRTFLTDDGINSLLFFLVFFTHMLLPLTVAVAVWLHISRLRRAKFLTERPLTWMILGTLVLVSLLVPAPLGDRAAMLVAPEGFTLDAWYLAPLLLAQRLSAGALWALSLIVSGVVVAVPWLFVRGRATAAVVDPPKCDECLKCVQDCPYGAISMVPRNDPSSKRPTVALVDPSLCVGCGICTGSCDSSGIGLDWLPAPSVRLEIDAWLAEREESEVVVYICEPSRTPDLTWDSETGRSAEIPGCRFIEVPCAGWVHPLTVERALRKGAAAVLIVGCPDGACPHREGGRTTEERMEGKREPSLRLEKVDGTQVWVLREPWADGRRIAQVVQALRRNERPSPRRLPPQAAALLGVVVAVGLVAAGSLVPYRTPYPADPELLLSVKHPGSRSEVCQERTQEELDRLPAHMRTATVCERERAPVTVRVFIDDALVESATLEAPGLSSDGIATGVVRVRPGTGEHLVRVEVSDTQDAETAHEEERRLTLGAHQRVVLAFERGIFEWHGAE